MHATILISAKQGAGKTTTANAIIKKIESQNHPTKPFNVSFAKTIYEMHDEIIKILHKRGIPVQKKKYGPLLQYLGTQFGRETDFGPEVGIDPDMWVKCLLGEIEELKTQHPNRELLFLVSDTRFRNELDGVHGLKVRLEASREVRKARCDGWRDTDTHQSEIDLDDYAKDKKFHLYINTETTTIEECVEQIGDALIDWVDNKLDLDNPIGYESVKHFYI